jgi:hypothetical protein
MPQVADPRVVLIEAELTRVRTELERALAAIPPDKLQRSPGPDVWTPAQLVWHLAKIERGVARMLERLDAELPPMSTVPPGPRKDGLIQMLDSFKVTDRSRRLASPEGAKPPAVIDLVAERGRLADGRKQLLDVARAAGPRLSLLRYDHLYFGPFDGWQWFLFVARHEERHLLQLAEVVANTK